MAAARPQRTFYARRFKTTRTQGGSSLSALLACELAPPDSATVPRRHERPHFARLVPQATPANVAIRWLRARGARDALPLLTAHPTSLTAEVHFRRTDAYWLVPCHRAGRLLRAAETPFPSAPTTPEMPVGQGSRDRDNLMFPIQLGPSRNGYGRWFHGQP